MKRERRSDLSSTRFELLASLLLHIARVVLLKVWQILIHAFKSRGTVVSFCSVRCIEFKNKIIYIILYQDNHSYEREVCCEQL